MQKSAFGGALGRVDQCMTWWTMHQEVPAVISTNPGSRDCCVIFARDRVFSQRTRIVVTPRSLWTGHALDGLVVDARQVSCADAFTARSGRMPLPVRVAVSRTRETEIARSGTARRPKRIDWTRQARIRAYHVLEGASGARRAYVAGVIGSISCRARQELVHSLLCAPDRVGDHGKDLAVPEAVQTWGATLTRVHVWSDNVLCARIALLALLRVVTEMPARCPDSGIHQGVAVGTVRQDAPAVLVCVPGSNDRGVDVTETVPVIESTAAVHAACSHGAIMARENASGDGYRIRRCNAVALRNIHLTCEIC
eukprot:1577856-Rhodomonas_salina.2